MKDDLYCVDMEILELLECFIILSYFFLCVYLVLFYDFLLSYLIFLDSCIILFVGSMYLGGVIIKYVYDFMESFLFLNVVKILELFLLGVNDFENILKKGVGVLVVVRIILNVDIYLKVLELGDIVEFIDMDIVDDGEFLLKIFEFEGDSYV